MSACPECRHAVHEGRCLNMASDGDCSCVVRSGGRKARTAAGTRYSLVDVLDLAAITESVRNRGDASRGELEACLRATEAPIVVVPDGYGVYVRSHAEPEAEPATVPAPRVETREDGTRVLVRSLHDLLPSDGVRHYRQHRCHPEHVDEFLNMNRNLLAVAAWPGFDCLWLLTVEVRRG